MSHGGGTRGLRRLVRTLIVTGGLIAMLGGAASAFQLADPTPGTATLIVKLADNLSETEQQAVVDRNGGTDTAEVPVLRLHMVEVPEADVSLYIDSYSTDPDVLRVEQDHTRDAEANPADP